MMLISAVLGLALGSSVSFLIYFLQRRRTLKIAKEDAQDILDEMESLAKERMDEAKNRAQAHADQLTGEFEKIEVELQAKVQTLQDKYEDKQHLVNEKLRTRESIYKRRLDTIKRQEELLEHKRRKAQRRFDALKQSREKYISQLSEKAEADKQDLIKDLCVQLENQAEVNATKFVGEFEERARGESEKKAKRLINIALQRFARPYCAERGIGYVFLHNEKVRKKVLGPERVNLKHMETVCGVDLIYNEDYHSVAVSGFDPVRRELARASLEKLINEREINEKRIQSIVAKTKKDLFKKIRNDGRAIAKELGCMDLHPEIKNMMGALRYRYSFAQNQHFHCAEVGHLCGMLAIELGLGQKDGRRTGMLHDIGKAMDHSIDGGHAVIGADFIEKHGENEDIVHAVRAHHYDETPNSDLAFLVIAADALSGARPGARRSTADSYVQKMGQLELIGNSFEGVTSTYILSAGREVRIHVDSQKLNDMEALELSKKVAHKIEEECNYPGLIKVTVVRETQAVEVAR